MKLKIFDPYGLRILEFHQNQSQKFFFIQRGDPYMKDADDETLTTEHFLIEKPIYKKNKLE